MVNVLQQMAKWSLVVIIVACSDCVSIKGVVAFLHASLQAVHRSSGSKLSNTQGILSMIHDLLRLINLLEGPNSLKLIPAKSTILQNR